MAHAAAYYSEWAELPLLFLLRLFGLMLCISAEMTSNKSTLTLLTDERRLYLVLSIAAAAANAAQCFLRKKTKSVQTTVLSLN